MYLDPGVRSKSYLEITLKGSGSFPKLVFDRREVILPSVPLGITSKSIFRVINDGYENLNLRHQVADELNIFDLNINFPEGKNLGVTKSKIKVEVSFKSNKPLSFTTKLEFFDDSRSYTIPISGTTDNCLFTNFPYLQRTSNEDYKILVHDKKPIVIQDENLFTAIDKSYNKSHGSGININYSRQGSLLSIKSSKSTRFNINLYFKNQS